MAKTEKKKTTDEKQFQFSYAKDIDSFLKRVEKDRETKQETKTIQFLIPKDEVREKRQVAGAFHVQQILFNVDFRFGHDGLNNIARQNGIHLSNLTQGNVIVFFNGAKNSMKVAFSEQDVFFHRQPGKIEERAIPEIMKKLNATGKLDYPDALASFLKKAVNKKTS